MIVPFFEMTLMETQLARPSVTMRLGMLPPFCTWHLSPFSAASHWYLSYLPSSASIQAAYKNGTYSPSRLPQSSLPMALVIGAAFGWVRGWRDGCTGCSVLFSGHSSLASLHAQVRIINTNNNSFVVPSTYRLFGLPWGRAWAAKVPRPRVKIIFFKFMLNVSVCCRQTKEKVKTKTDRWVLITKIDSYTIETRSGTISNC